eukprot:Plantae.Rhodophyta-Purpureofilum_apyrenoidigerum.ctg4480.p1 GENE.Plantae.Rhodophyta-Purpureofilum_apyrenoidigerum.ctg4480~~Plantae.Rhodophyta-Purpureofilum_apyrenoidigerum.ctg4480.p1  ORF type:complete len:516 (+),score=65.88 Plantae.Rhodophyta-Purpureofilum_apyrenoidigerum.ctg4480:24-1550(+)
MVGFVPGIGLGSRQSGWSRCGVQPERAVLGRAGRAARLSMTATVKKTDVDLRELRSKIASLVLFDEFRRMPRTESFPSLVVVLLDYILEGKMVDAIEVYTRLWVITCGAGGKGWKGEVLAMIYNAGGGNPFTELIFADENMPPHALDAAAKDLRILQTIAEIDPRNIIAWMNAPHLPIIAKETGYSDTLPGKADDFFRKLSISSDWGSHVQDLASTIRYLGIGITGEFYGLMYTGGELLGILSREEALNTDQTRFVGVEDILDKIKRNTEYLVNGFKSQNALLYGPPGCGKSSMIRSLVNLFGDQGLRVVEVAKQELRTLPSLVALLSTLPHSFIVFIDDLSYAEYEAEAMREGKAALEGSLRVNCDNIAIYVTSNRRHPAVNSIADETSEKLAFSHRFGLTLQFPDATRRQYANIVTQLAADANIDLPHAELQRRSLLWAFGHHNPTDSNGLSGRTARQFIDYLIADSALRDQGSESGSIDWGATPGTPWYACVEDDLVDSAPNVFY